MTTKQQCMKRFHSHHPVDSLPLHHAAAHLQSPGHHSQLPYEGLHTILWKLALSSQSKMKCFFISPNNLRSLLPNLFYDNETDNLRKYANHWYTASTVPLHSSGESLQRQPSQVHWQFPKFQSTELSMQYVDKIGLNVSANDCTTERNADLIKWRVQYSTLVSSKLEWTT